MTTSKRPLPLQHEVATQPPSPKKWLLFLTFAAGLAVVLCQRHWPAQQGDNQTNETIEALNRDVQMLRKEIDRRASTAGIAATTKTERTDVAPASNPIVQTSASDEPKEPELTVEEHHRQLTDELEERFQREPADRQWNAEATHKIKRSVTANAPSTRVLEASCATTMCKVVVSHDSLTAQRELGAKLALEEPFRSGVYYDYDHESNPPTTTLYVMRD